jgi:hypothetical protein
MTAARTARSAILATAVAGHSRLMDEHEAGTARALAIATSTVTIFNDRSTRGPAGGSTTSVRKRNSVKSTLGGLLWSGGPEFALPVLAGGSHLTDSADSNAATFQAPCEAMPRSEG